MAECSQDHLLEAAVSYLSSALESSVQWGYGEEDRSVNKRTEAELCDLFEQVVGGDFFLVDGGGQLCVFSGRRFVRMDADRMVYIVKKTLKRLGVGVVYQKNSPDMIARRCMENLLSEEHQRFEPDRQWVIFQDRVLNVRTGECAEHSRQYRSDVYLDFRYRPEVRSALWDRVVMETVPDEGMRKAFQQFCGAFLVNREEFKIEYICLMVGSGRNGKSVVCKAIADLFGKELVSAYSPEQLFRSSQSMYNLADIDGKIANYADDVSNKDFSGGDFKQFISGASFQARHIYGKPFMVTKVPLMMCCVNEMPPTSDDSNGYFRRLLPIVCPHIIADADVDVALPGKLATEESRQAIFNWLYEGYCDLVANGGVIQVSDSIVKVREDIREDSNSARRWLRDRNGNGGWICFSELMSEYMEYCRKMGEPCKSQKGVAKTLRDVGVRFEKRRTSTFYYMESSDAVEVPLPDDDDKLPF